jgi:hypothetical protein
MRALIIAGVWTLFSSPAFAESITVTVNPNSLPTTTVASLPACSASTQGLQYIVTNALTPVVLSAVVGGGAVVVKTYCNGTTWIVG